MRATTLAACLVPILLAAGCGGEPPAQGDPGLEVWVHSGQPGERRVIADQVARFNAAGHGFTVDLTIIPEGSYNAQVLAAALAGELPDLLEFDGPFLYGYAWQGHLRPLDDLLPRELRTDLLPTILAQGTYRGRLYSVGTFESGLGLWADRRRLEAAGARIPGAPGEAWSADEFDRLLERLAAVDEDGAVLDLKLNYTGEWFTYAFAPILESGGAGLLRDGDPPRAAGVLNGPAAVETLGRLQSWIRSGRVDPNLDDAAFTTGRVALSWVGHWEYPRYREALGENLVLLPLPDFGEGSRTGQGSWNWGITQNSRHPERAMKFLSLLFRPEEVLAMTDANGAVPATRSAIARSPLFRPGAQLHLLVRQLEETAVPRPRTPAYPVITSAFQQAFGEIRDGLPVQTALDRAAALIDQDIRDNQGYP